MLFLASAIIFLIAIVVSSVLTRRARAERYEIEAQALAELEMAGLVPRGAVLGTYEIQARVHGVDLTVSNRSLRVRPGAQPAHSLVCLVSLNVALPDQIVCRAAEADQVLGPLPAVPRVHTGHASFDAQYAVFIGNASDSAGTIYRGDAAARGIQWARPPILDALIALDLRWLRVREGRAEIALAPLEAEDVARAVSLAVAISAPSASQTTPALSREARTLPKQPVNLRALVVGTWALSALAAFFGWIPLSFIPVLRTANEEMVCGAGDHIAVYRSSDGSSTSYDLGCVFHQQNSLVLHNLSCALLAASTVALFGLVNAGMIAAQARNRRGGGAANAHGSRP